MHTIFVRNLPIHIRRIDTDIARCSERHSQALAQTKHARGVCVVFASLVISCALAINAKRQTIIELNVPAAPR